MKVLKFENMKILKVWQQLYKTVLISLILSISFTIFNPILNKFEHVFWNHSNNVCL